MDLPIEVLFILGTILLTLLISFVWMIRPDWYWNLRRRRFENIGIKKAEATNDYYDFVRLRYGISFLFLLALFLAFASAIAPFIGEDQDMTFDTVESLPQGIYMTVDGLALTIHNDSAAKVTLEGSACHSKLEEEAIGLGLPGAWFQEKTIPTELLVDLEPGESHSLSVELSQEVWAQDANHHYISYPIPQSLKPIKNYYCKELYMVGADGVRSKLHYPAQIPVK